MWCWWAAWFAAGAEPAGQDCLTSSGFSLEWKFGEEGKLGSAEIDR